MSVAVGTSIVTSNLLLEIDPSNIKSYQENLIAYSQSFVAWNGTIGWILQNLTATSTTNIAPDGTSTATLLTTTAAGYTPLYCPNFTVVANSTLTASVYFKSASATTFSITVGNAGLTNNFYASVSNVTTTPTITAATFTGSGTYIGSTLTSVGNGWYRLSVTGIIDSSTTAARLDFPIATGFSGVGLLVWGAQVNYGTGVAPYTPTILSNISQTMYDLLGNGYTNTSYNLPTLSSIGNGSISLNGTNQSFSITKPNPNVGGQITLDMWIYLNSISTTPVIIHKGSHFVFVIYTTNTYSYADSSNYNFGNYGSRTATGIGTTGVWKHIVVTKDISSVVRVYLNGSLADTSPVFGSGISQTTSTLWIGGYSDTDTNPSVNMINGYVGPYKIYNIALTADQVTQNFNATRSRFGI
jgi:hypothetical protein